MKLAEVYIEHSSLQLDQSFSYLCGHAEVRPGMRVSVPFAKQQLVGFVDSVKEVSADELKQMPYELKEIQRVIDERPLLHDELLQLGKWMAAQYVAPLISCYQAMLPGVLQPKSSARSAAMEEWACFAGARAGLSKRQRAVQDDMKTRGSMRAAEDAAAAETLRGLLKECNAAYFQSELSAAVNGVDGDTVNVNASAASGAIAEGTALSFTLDQSVNNTLNGALQEGTAVLIVYDAESYDAQSGQIGKVFVLTEAQNERASHGRSFRNAADRKARIFQN